MTNISKARLNSKDYKLAYTQLAELIANLDKQTSQFLISDLLTEAEQIMVVKRFAAALMFHHQYSPYRVSETLSISTSTARRLYEQYTNGKFASLLGCVKKKTKNQFLSLIEDIIMAQVSPRARSRLLHRAGL